MPATLSSIHCVRVSIWLLSMANASRISLCSKTPLCCFAVMMIFRIPFLISSGEIDGASGFAASFSFAVVFFGFSFSSTFLLIVAFSFSSGFTAAFLGATALSFFSIFSFSGVLAAVFLAEDFSTSVF